MLGLDYYQHAFALLHKDLEETGYNGTIPHPKRETFWSLVPYGHHGSTEARTLLLQYARAVEERIKEIVEGASLAYWLHLYRRIAPGPTVQRDSSVTVGITRAALEAGFQKYAQLNPCERVGLSTSVQIDKVLGGILQGPEFELERKHISEQPQLVMMEFSTSNLRELYDLEKLAFEIWRTGAHLRCVGKGSGIRVTNDLERVADDRSGELDTLVRRFDARNNAVYGLPNTMSGTVLDPSRSEVNGLIMIPGYNLDLARIQPHHRRYFAKAFHIKVTKSWRPNFFWSVFDLRGYYRTHQPLATGFAQLHGVSYHSVFAVLAAISFRTLFRSVASGGGTIFHSWQRAYEGPYLRTYVVQELKDHGPAAKKLLGMTDQEWQDVGGVGPWRFI
jgi:hypothetical protein